MIQVNSDLSQNDTATGEKRVVRRQRVLKGGTLFFNNGYASYQCRVRNFSENGALLELGETTGLPNEFDFKLDSGGFAQKANMVWKSRHHIGISFS